MSQNESAFYFYFYFCICWFFVVSFITLRIAQEYGLHCMMNSNFHDFVHEHLTSPAVGEKLDEFRDNFVANWASILDAEGRVPADTWDIACTPR